MKTSSGRRDLLRFPSRALILVAAAVLCRLGSGEGFDEAEDDLDLDLQTTAVVSSNGEGRLQATFSGWPATGAKYTVLWTLQRNKILEHVRFGVVELPAAAEHEKKQGFVVDYVLPRSPQGQVDCSLEGTTISMHVYEHRSHHNKHFSSTDEFRFWWHAWSGDLLALSNCGVRALGEDSKSFGLFQQGSCRARLQLAWPVEGSYMTPLAVRSQVLDGKEANVYQIRMFAVLLGAGDLMVEREMIGIMQTAYKSLDPMHVIAEIRSWPKGLLQVVAFLRTWCACARAFSADIKVRSCANVCGTHCR